MMQTPPIQITMPEAPEGKNRFVKRDGALVFMVIMLAASIAVAFAISNGKTPAARLPASQSAASAAVSEDSFSDIKILAKSAIVVDLHTNKILYAHNPNIQLPL